MNKLKGLSVAISGGILITLFQNCGGGFDSNGGDTVASRSVASNVDPLKESEEVLDEGADEVVNGAPRRISNSSAYKYDFAPPYVPPVVASGGVSDSKIDQYDIPEEGMPRSGRNAYSGSLGSPDKVLLLVAPNKPIKAGIYLKGLKYAGVYLIGATFSHEGMPTPPLRKKVPLAGGHYFEIQFANIERTRPPFIFVANVAADSEVDAKGKRLHWWGDLFRIGGEMNPAKNNTGNFARLFLQKTKVTRGSYGFTTDDGGYAPHSDIVQPISGGVRDVYFSEVDTAWAYQGLFLKQSGPDGMRVDGYLPTDATVDLKKVRFRQLPNNSTVNVANPVGHRLGKVAIFSGNLADITSGNYFNYKLSQAYCDFDPELDERDMAKYFSYFGLTAIKDEKAKTVTFVPSAGVRPGKRTAPMTGSFKFGTASQNPEVVNTTHIGHNLRVDKTKFRQLFAVTR